MERNLINKMNEGWAADTTPGATLRRQRAVVTGKQRHAETRGVGDLAISDQSIPSSTQCEATND